jgi:hypothetical protein
MDLVMTIEKVELIKIKPSPNMRLTNGIDIAEGEVCIGVGDLPDNWYEITDEEYEKIKAERVENNE